MKTAGVVAEYNPFHSGHKYQIDKTKEKTGLPVIAVMSGNFVQRGECALFDKSVRTRAALMNGADIVFELPLPWAMSSAEKFASGAVYLLNSTGICEFLSFGSESGNVERITDAADALLNIDENIIKKYLTDGCSYPTARQKALEESAGEEISSVLSSPNDLLGVEYVKSVIKNKYPLTPITIKRSGAGHDSDETNKSTASASAVRSIINSSLDYSPFVPENTLELYRKSEKSDMKDLEKCILSHLRRKKALDFLSYPDVSEGLEYRIYEAVRDSDSLDSLYSKIKTKRYAHSRIRRIIMSAFLEIDRSYTLAAPPYLRVLGFTDEGRNILKQMKNTASVPVIMRYSDVNALDERAKKVFELECKSTDLFALAFNPVLKCGNEMRREIIYVHTL